MVASFRHPWRWVTPVMLVAAVAASCAQPQPDQAQPSSQPYRFQAVSLAAAGDGKVTVGSVELTLRNPDGPTPKVWDGPLALRALPAGASCEAEPSLITAIFLDSSERTAIVQSYSGSTTYLDFIDVATCKAMWPRIEAATEGVAVEGDRLTVLPGCEGQKERSQCNAGEVFLLRPDAAPQALDADSRQLTKARLGVEFVGQAWVQAPGAPGAKLLETAPP